MTRKQGRFVSAFLIAGFLAAGITMENSPAERYENAAAYVGPFASAAHKASKSVVGINNYQEDRLFSAGSGVVVFDQYILTNYHVIEGAQKLTVVFSGKEIRATVCAYDSGLDAAVLYAKKLNADAALLGDSDMLKVGEWAICVGNPVSEELRTTFTLGIVSALDREIASHESQDRYGLKITRINTMIQTDAAINSGSSGGGLFNVLGQLMGIPTMKYTSSGSTGAPVEGISLAIPINSAKPLIERAIREKLTDENLNLGV
ncbi:MAG: trypsin-like peptidase domain-containing protein [Clostridia bacterium]|nr:trypsin-like peptidase domain-containing protein [Clostridia bacterium]